MKLHLDRPWRTALLSALIAWLVCITAGWAYVHYLQSSRQQLARTLAQSFSLRVAQRLHETVSPVYMLASMVKQNQGNVPDFDKVAPDLLQEFPLARALELAPAGVVRQVYPLRGNEAIIGHDLLKDRGRNKEAHVALVKRQLMVAGPFELIQGGLGAVARYPVFMPDGQGKNSFWGFAIVLIHVHELLANAGEMEFERKGFDYQLCRVTLDVEGEGCKSFYRSAESELQQPLVVPIDLPNNQWRLSVAPSGGWVSPGEWIGLAVAILISGLLVGGTLLLRLSQREAEKEDGKDDTQGMAGSGAP
jgi:sensor domain CHASE-containing protein